MIKPIRSREAHEMKGKNPLWNVYRIETYYGECGEVRELTRNKIGSSRAASAKKAICNVQYHVYGKAVYGGGYTTDTGMDTCVDTTFEAVMAEE